MTSKARPKPARSSRARRGCRTLVLVRHGHFTLEDLTRIGRVQAAHAGRRLRDLPITAIHCSTMPRAEQTARIIARTCLRQTLRRSNLLRECVPGLPATMRKKAQLSSASLRRGKQQAERAYRRYFRPAAGADRCDVLVCHGNIIRYLVCRALALDDRAWVRLGTSHAGVTIVRILPNGETVLHSYNDTGHLPLKLRST